MRRSARGVSNVVAVSLLLVVVMAGSAVVVVVGATALEDARDGLDTSRAEKVLTQFDSRSAMVALGGTSRQGVELADGRNAGYGVDADAGWMNVSITESGTATTGLVNVTLGAVAYENGRDVVAYQGGGVWKRTASGTTMVSPPEFHFRGATLTLPIIVVDGDAFLGSSATVSQTAPTSVRYPNASQDPRFVNPLDRGYVNVTVGSDFYRSWGAYFEERTDGEVFYDHGNETARVRLVVPFNEEYDDVVATTASGGITVRGSDPIPTPSETGVDYPLADSRIEDRIEECESDLSACDESTPFDAIASQGTYYHDGAFSGDLAVDTGDGNVTVVVNGDFEPSSVSTTGDNVTTVLVRGDFDVNSDVNVGGVPGDFPIAVHSEGAVEVRGDTDVSAFVYAPGSTCNLRGSGVLTGGAVCETAELRGNPSDFVYDPSIEDADLNLVDGTRITFLHVTVNRVQVTD